MAGDAAAMNALYDRYRVEVHSWLVHATGDAAEAEDLYQEAWLKIIENASRFNGGSFRAWLWRIVRNLAIDRARKKRPLLTLDGDGGDDGDGADEVPGDDGSGAFAAMEEAEMRAAAKRAVLSLAEHEKEVVLLRVESSLGFKEIARILGIPVNTALARMHRALAKLKTALAADGI